MYWTPNQRCPLPFGKILHLCIYYIFLMNNLLLIVLNDISTDKQKINFWMFGHLILLLFWVLCFFFLFLLFSFFFSVPLELVDLPLVKFDFSCNKVLVIPICFREMKQLQVLLLENNPLQSPPAQVRGLAKIRGICYQCAQATLGRASLLIFCWFNVALNMIISSYSL